MRATLALLLMLMMDKAFDKSFGVIGEAFPVAEKSFLTLIDERLRALEENGEFERFNQRWVDRVSQQANRPTPLDLKRTHESISHAYLPQMTLSQDILDAKGRVLYQAGTHINALEKMPSYQPCWLFFNGDDEAQVLWAKRQGKACAHPKFILTGGAVFETERRLDAVIYFDQGARLTQRLAIKHVPAKVDRRGNALNVLEEAISEYGDVL